MRYTEVAYCQRGILRISTVIVFAVLVFQNGVTPLSAEECTGVLECAEEHVGQEPEVSLSETLCESYQKLGITAEDLPSALRYCKEYHDVYSLAQKLRSPAAEKAYHDVQEFARKAGLTDSLNTLVEKGKEIDPQELLEQLKGMVGTEE
jgi:hypothetical protein